MNVAMLEAQLQTERDAAVARLKAISELAEQENRERTDDEDAELKGLVDKANKTKALLARAKGDADLVAQVAALSQGTGGNGTGHRLPARKQKLSMGQQWVQGAGHEFIKGGGHRRGSRWATPAVELFDPSAGYFPPDFYAATLTEDPASGGALITPQYVPGILPILYKTLTVADLFAQGTADSNVVVYMKEKVFTNAAAPVLEGGTKPESALTFEQAQDAIRKIAHWLPVSEEMLEDVAQIRSYIDARLRLGVQLKEEDQLLYGTGTAPELAGLLTRAGLAADVAVGVAPDTAMDAILRQMMAIYSTSFLQPDGVIVNPADWAEIILTKGGDGNYLTSGPFAPVQSATLWGLPVVVTPSVTAGTAVVGAFKSGGQVWRKGGITVEATNAHADFFIKNLVAIRAEERLALAIYRPGAFGKVTGV